MKTTSQAATVDAVAVYTIRVKRRLLDGVAELAAMEHRTLAQKIRVMMEAELAAAGQEREARQPEREVIHHVCGDDCSTTEAA